MVILYHYHLIINYSYIHKLIGYINIRMDKKSISTLVLLIASSLILHQVYYNIDTSADTKLMKFRQWTSQYGKIYQSESEMNYRFNIFTQTLSQIAENNIQYQKGLRAHLEGLNQFSDLTFDEWKKLYLMQFSSTDLSQVNSNCKGPQIPTTNLPVSVDWSNVTTPAIEQGKCAAGAFAISTTGSLEHLQLKATGRLIKLSTQQLIDCSAKDCTKMNPQSLFQYVLDNGITSDQRYPYTQQVSDRCAYDRTMKNFEINQCTVVTTKSQLALRATVSRISATALFDGSPLKNYKKGIFTPGGITSKDSCYKPSINYSGLIVGYGVEGKNSYWKIRVSFGPSYGQEGYFRLLRTPQSADTGACAIQTTGLFPLV